MTIQDGSLEVPAVKASLKREAIKSGIDPKEADEAVTRAIDHEIGRLANEHFQR